MLRVVIVEDEADHQRAIEASIPWVEQGFLLQGLAADGQEGLDLLRRYQPDILILDVNMPRLSGLDLARHARDEFPGVKLLFLSGHDDFDYLKSALSVSAVDYLLKPVNPGDLTASLQKIADLCRQEELARQDSDLARRRLAESFPLLRERFVRDLLTGRSLPGDQTGKFEFLELNPGVPPWYVLSVRIGGMIGKSDRDELQRRALVESLDRLPDLGSRMVKCWTGERELAVVLGSKGPGQPVSPADLELLCWHLCWHYRGTGQEEPVIGISRPVYRMEGWRQGLTMSMEALACHSAQDPIRIIHHSDIIVVRPDPESLEDLESALLGVIRTGDDEGCASLLGPWFASLAPQQPFGWIRGLSMNLILSALKAGSRMSGQPGPSPDESTETWAALGACTELSELTGVVIDRCRQIARSVTSSQRDRRSSIVGRALGAIQAEFHHNLTLADLAARESITPYYFGNLFKREVGVSFADYLNTVRLEHARQLLLNGDSLTYEVASASGYSNVSYFCSQFKNRFGLSPKQFRENQNPRVSEKQPS